jgi:hypothetical protein
MKPVIIPLTLGELLQKTLHTLQRVFVPSLLVSLILFLIPGLLLLGAIDGVCTSVGDFLAAASASHWTRPPQESGILEAVLIFGLVGIAVFVVLVLARLTVTLLACADLFGVPLTFQQALRKASRAIYGKMVGQVILETAALAGINLFVYLMVFALAKISLLLLLLGAFPLVLGVMVLDIWLVIRWSMTYPIMACEDTGILESFKRSSELVSGEWWRVFGILILVGVMREIAVGCVTAPVGALAMWDFTSLVFSGGVGSSPDPIAAGKMISSLGIGFGITLTLTLVLSNLIIPVYTSVLYIDLRARAGEFGKTSFEEILPRPESADDDKIFFEGSPWG